MDKAGEAVKKSTKGPRSRTSSVSELRSRSGSTSGLSKTTADLQGESQKMKALAATATAKAQHKMTEFVSAPERAQVQEQVMSTSAPLSGAGELPSGPCGSADAATAAAAAAALGTGSLVDQAVRIHNQIKQIRDSQAQGTSASTPGGSAQPNTGEDEDGDWQVWTSRKNRRIGEELDREYQRQVREKTPFQLPGQQQHGENRGYYTSAAARNSDA